MFGFSTAVQWLDINWSGKDAFSHPEQSDYVSRRKTLAAAEHVIEVDADGKLVQVCASWSTNDAKPDENGFAKPTNQKFAKAKVASSSKFYQPQSDEIKANLQLPKTIGRRVVVEPGGVRNFYFLPGHNDWLDLFENGAKPFCAVAKAAPLLLTGALAEPISEHVRTIKSSVFHAPIWAAGVCAAKQCALQATVLFVSLGATAAVTSWSVPPLALVVAHMGRTLSGPMGGLIAGVILYSVFQAYQAQQQRQLDAQQYLDVLAMQERHKANGIDMWDTLDLLRTIKSGHKHVSFFPSLTNSDAPVPLAAAAIDEYVLSLFAVGPDQFYDIASLLVPYLPSQERDRVLSALDLPD